jgi:hypothetical protein
MKKHFFCITLLSVLLANSYSQDLLLQKQLYERKIASYSKLKTSGAVMGVCGGALTVIGVYLVSNATWETHVDYYGNTQTTTSDPGAAMGIVSIAAGIPIAVTGIVLGSIGNKKVKYYRKKLDHISVDYKIRSNQQQFTIAYRF